MMHFCYFTVLDKLRKIIIYKSNSKERSEAGKLRLAEAIINYEFTGEAYVSTRLIFQILFIINILIFCSRIIICHNFFSFSLFRITPAWFIYLFIQIRTEIEKEFLDESEVSHCFLFSSEFRNIFLFY